MPRWHKISSMDKKRLNDAMMVCMGLGITYHYSDDGVNPYAVWFYCDDRTYKLVMNRVGYYKL